MAEIAKIKGYDIRDKKLADATSQSTVAATDAIEMKTTSGDQVYITRDSFIDAIAAVFKSNSKSTITTLFGEETSGNTSSIGSINMSNLASVLGVATSREYKFKACNFVANRPFNIYIPFKGSQPTSQMEEIIFPVYYAFSGKNIGISIVALCNYDYNSYAESEVLNLVSGRTVTLNLDSLDAPYINVTNANNHTVISIPWVAYNAPSSRLQEFYNMDFHH